VVLQGFSLRSRRDAAAVRFGSEVARVDAHGERGAGVPYTTSVTIDRNGGKRILVDGSPPASLDELRRLFPVLAFTPDRLAVVKGGPLVRRTYLDRMLGRVQPARASLPSDYASALAQRNAALRRAGAGLSSQDAIEPWTDAVARLGAELDEARAAVVGALAPRFAAFAARLGLAEAVLGYTRTEVTVESLAARLARDLERGTTGLGPHLADLELTAGERDLRAYGSQGEQRAAMLALLLAEAEALLDLRGEPPLLLLDDVLSELDEGRREALLAAVPAGSQVVVTATSPRALPARVRADLVVDVEPGRAVVR
jgi:DNA replication and repair protein RecF